MATFVDFVVEQMLFVLLLVDLLAFDSCRMVKSDGFKWLNGKIRVAKSEYICAV